MTATAAPPHIASDDINVAQVNKRKLSEVDVEQPKVNGVASESTPVNGELADAISINAQTVLKDIATVLQRYGFTAFPNVFSLNRPLAICYMT